MSMEVSFLGLTFLPSVPRKALIVHWGRFSFCCLLDESWGATPSSVDPTIRISYLPRVKKIKRSAFSKNVNHTFYQRITIVNTKSIAIERLKIIDQFPISEDSAISVALANPALAIPLPNKKGEVEVPKPLNIGDGVIAQWADADHWTRRGSRSTRERW